jgi:hypothetical protein
MEGLSQDYLDRITRSVGGTVAKPAQPNTRSDAASTNEAATAVAGAGPGVPAWKQMCVVMEGEFSTFHDRWCAVLSPTRKYWWSNERAGMWFERNVKSGVHGEVYIGVKRASEALAACHTCPPDWPTQAHADDPREEPERFDEATGPMAEDERKPYPFGIVVKGESYGWNIYSASGNYCLDRLGWAPSNRIDLNFGGRAHMFDCLRDADEAAYKISTPPPDWSGVLCSKDGGCVVVVPGDKPMPQAFTTVETTTRTDPMPGSPYARKITKPCESIERLVDRLAKVNGAIEVSHGMQYRVTGQVEKAEPRTHDEPGYPEHFALHHVFLPEDWTRGILNAIAYDLAGKLDTGTIRTVLESASRALLLTGELDEADLLGLAVAVEDKLDIGK